jgi:hypothetical protein
MMESCYGDSFVLTLITKSPEIAGFADDCNINRVGVDLERLGKVQRQQGLGTRLSDHTLADLQRLAAVVGKKKLFARLNPLNQNTQREINEVIEAGARFLMLPYFESALDVDRFVRVIDERATPIALLETAPALVRVREVMQVSGLAEVMIGLNDLRLSLGVQSHFELLCSPVLDMVAAEAAKLKMPLTIGGIAPPSTPGLPVPADLVLAQYPRLRARGAWLARSSFGPDVTSDSLKAAVQAIRTRLQELACLSDAELERYRDALKKQLRSV